MGLGCFLSEDIKFDSSTGKILNDGTWVSSSDFFLFTEKEIYKKKIELIFSQLYNYNLWCYILFNEFSTTPTSVKAMSEFCDWREE